MSLTGMLANMTSVEIGQRMALDSIRHKEAKQRERMAKAKRR